MIVLKYKKLKIKFQLFNKYSGTELNRHSHYCEQDFKSCVSTSSTTRVKHINNKNIKDLFKNTRIIANPDITSGRVYQFHHPSKTHK